MTLASAVQGFCVAKGWPEPQAGLVADAALGCLIGLILPAVAGRKASVGLGARGTYVGQGAWELRDS